MLRRSVEEGRQWGSLVKVEVGLCRCDCMAVLHATLGSRVQVDTIASQCMPIFSVVSHSRPSLLLPSSCSLACGFPVVLKFEVPYRRGREVERSRQNCRQKGRRKESSLAIEATLAHALITSQVRRMRSRSDMFCAGHVGGETSPPLGEKEGGFARDEGLRWPGGSQVRDRKVADGGNAK